MFALGLSNHFGDSVQEKRFLATYPAHQHHAKIIKKGANQGDQHDRANHEKKIRPSRRRDDRTLASVYTS